jgi:hypothetical protein
LKKAANAALLAFRADTNSTFADRLQGGWAKKRARPRKERRPSVAAKKPATWCGKKIANQGFLL